MTRALLQQALSALERCTKYEQRDYDAMDAIREYLDNTKDVEPVAEVVKSDEWSPSYIKWIGIPSAPVGSKLYLHPAPIPLGMVLVGWLDGRTRLFSVDDPMYKDRHEGMREVYAAAKGETK